MAEPLFSFDRRRTAVAVILIAAGLFFLLAEAFDIRIGDVFWPLLILVPGLILLGAAFSTSRANTGLAGPGAAATLTGLIFIYQEATDHWESWAYVWTLYPVAVGLALIAAGTRNGEEDTIRSGRAAARWGIIAFIIAAVLFELLIFDRGGVGGWLLPAALIAVGVGLLYRESRHREAWAQSTAAYPPSPPPPPTPSASTAFPPDELPRTPSAEGDAFPADDQSIEPPAPTRRASDAAPRDSGPSGGG